MRSHKAQPRAIARGRGSLHWSAPLASTFLFPGSEVKVGVCICSSALRQYDEAARCCVLRPFDKMPMHESAPLRRHTPRIVMVRDDWWHIPGCFRHAGIVLRVHFDLEDQAHWVETEDSALDGFCASFLCCQTDYWEACNDQLSYRHVNGLGSRRVEWFGF